MNLGAWMNRDEQGNFTHDAHADDAVCALRAGATCTSRTYEQDVRENSTDVASSLDAPRRLNVRFVSSYQGVADFHYDHTHARVSAAWEHTTGTYYVRDELGRRVLEQYEADQRAEWDRWLSHKSVEDRASFGPYPTRHVVIDAAEWEARVYPKAVAL